MLKIHSVNLVRDPLDVDRVALGAAALTRLVVGLAVGIVTGNAIVIATTIAELTGDLVRRRPQLALEVIQLPTEEVAVHHLHEVLKREHRRKSR